ncbi:hypothetical protein ACQ4LE_010447 [Meloidogyne hapla]|uniref:Disintegrin domain-containing protein n=1 Tax=Meloidogyne hapla TaxID=6305 RepID=A0A1I8B9F8_MELHA
MYKSSIIFNYNFDHQKCTEGKEEKFYRRKQNSNFYKQIKGMLLLGTIFSFQIKICESSSHSYHHRYDEQHVKCSVEGSICSTSRAQLCRNNTCVSVCSVREMRECRCDSEEDNYCFLCCGNERNRCLPAHEHGILRDNGERWERDACTRCRMNGDEMDGMPCDDQDTQRLCLQGKCSKSVCVDKQQGQYCDKKSEKICVDDVCENPCAKISPYLMICECPAIDPDTGFASEDRCQLCCFDYHQKPSTRRCRNAHRNYGIKSAQDRPIWRIGLECAGGKRCNRYGICSNDASPGGRNQNRVSTTLLAIIIFSILILAVLITSSSTIFSETF